VIALSMMTLWPACRFAGGGLFVVLALRRDKRRALNYFSAGQGEWFVARADLIQAYISALPFAPIAIVAIPGGCRIEIGGTSAPAFYFKASHIELVLGAAGLAAGPINQPPAAVAALIERAARRLHAPYETEPEIMAAAERQVDAIMERVRASNQSGGMILINGQYKAYRTAQLAKAEAALPYSKFIEPFVITMLRQVAMTGRMV
jgi:hypothetical protein